MTKSLAAVLALSSAIALSAQETGVPKDSDLVSLQGCAKNNTFIVGERREDAPGSLAIGPGRRFRLNGPKKLLNEIKARQRTVIEVTGLIRKADVAPQGVSVLGGRVRIGGARPQDPISAPGRDPAYDQAVIDVRAYRALEGSCK
jgi:hypothetical protein